MSEIIYYSDIDGLLKSMNVPLMKWPDFYIVKFEDHDFTNFSHSYHHDFYEISISIGYDAFVSIGHNRSNVIDFNLAFLSPGQISRWETNRKTTDTLGLMILFKPEFLTTPEGVFSFFERFPFFNHHTMPCYRLTDEQKALFSNLLLEMNEEFKLTKKGSREIIQSYLNIFLHKAKRELDMAEAGKLLSTRADQITFNFENLLKRTSHKRQSLKYYADQLNISAVYLAECVKKVSGKTAKQVIDEYVILEAKSLLKHAEQSIAEIAYVLGFSDNSNFVKYFKKQTGQTPKVFKGES